MTAAYDFKGYQSNKNALTTGNYILVDRLDICPKPAAEYSCTDPKSCFLTDVSIENPDTSLASTSHLNGLVVSLSNMLWTAA